MGKTNFAGVGNASWVASPTLLLRAPQFSVTTIIAMIIVMAVTAVETHG